MLELVTFILLAFASFRLTRLVVIDSITESVRDRVHNWLATRNHFNWFWDKILDALTCTWCTGVWVSTGLYLLHVHFSWAPWVIIPAAIAGAQGMLHALEPDDE